MSSAPTLVDPGPRRQHSFGGVVPSAAVVTGGETMVAVLAVEHHAEGAVLPVLALSEAPGVLGWDAAAGLEVSDDRGTEYTARTLAQQAGLGTLQATVWIEPPIPAAARRLEVVVQGLTRTSPARGGPGVERPLSGGPWPLVVDLLPERTAAEPPPPPRSPASSPVAGDAPTRALSAFRDVVPVGQARIGDGAAVCLWALERYAGRAVLDLAVLVEEPGDTTPLTTTAGRVEVWDDRGRDYGVEAVAGSAGRGWSETSLAIRPGIDPTARRLGVRLADLAADGLAGARASALAGPFLFGVALPPSP